MWSMFYVLQSLYVIVCLMCNVCIKTCGSVYYAVVVDGCGCVVDVVAMWMWL